MSFARTNIFSSCFNRVDFQVVVTLTFEADQTETPLVHGRVITMSSLMGCSDVSLNGGQKETVGPG